MQPHEPEAAKRRDVLRVGLALPGMLLLEPLAGASSVSAHSASAPPTPSCGDGDEPTPELTAGPFFKPRSPARGSLVESGVERTRIVIAGTVLSTACRPFGRALLDFWQADGDGDYDNAGYRLRGHQFTDDHGRYRLETILPGGYSGRTPHIHVRVQAPSRGVLTTQLFFPGEARNRRDFLFRPELLLKQAGEPADRAFAFDFVVMA